MNRIYRLVWSESRHSWVAASELSSQRRRLSRQTGAARSARALLVGGLALCALAYHPASHAEAGDDAHLDDLKGLVAKYANPTTQPARDSLTATLNAQALDAVTSHTAATLGTMPSGSGVALTQKLSVPAHHGSLISAGAHIKGSAPVLPSGQQMASGIAIPADVEARVRSSAGAGADGSGLNRGGVSAVAPMVNDAVDRVRSVTLAPHAAVTSSLLNDNAAPAGVLGADGLVHVAIPALPLAQTGAALPPVNGKAGVAIGVADNHGDLADVHAHLGVATPALAGTTGVGANVDLHVGANLGNVLGSSPGTAGIGGAVAGVTSIVNSAVGAITTGNPLAGSASALLPQIDTTVHNVATTVSGALTPVTAGVSASSLPATIQGVTSTVNAVAGAAAAGTPVSGTTGALLQPVTSTLHHLASSLSTGAGSLGGALGSTGNTSARQLPPDLNNVVSDTGTTLGTVLSQPTGNGVPSSLGQGGGAAPVLNDLTNTAADTANSVPGVQLGSTGNGQSSGQNLLNVVPGASNAFDKALPSFAPLLGAAPQAPVANAPGPAAPQGVPVVPPPSATPTGLIVGNGGVVGTPGQLLGSNSNSLFNNTNGYVTNGGLQVNSANFTQGYSVVSVLGIPTVSLAPVGTTLTTVGGTTLGGTGSNSHLTLIGAVKSDSYITNINNGAPGGLLGLALPNSAPAWASTCANVLGVVNTSCWAVNAAQDYQVLMGDGATANGSKEVVIGTNATHTLPAVNANTAFPGNGTNDPNNPSGVPTADYEARLGHSVVIGDSASGTANAQTIIGAEATASAANSVALGYQSSASRGAQTNYSAYGLTALQNSAGEVSIGTPGNERQITNVAAGSAPTDAVNVAQLEGVAITAGNAVQYDDATRASATLTGTTSTDGGVTGGTLLSNLHQGAITSSSTQAINGAQLWQWTQNTGNVYSNYSLYNAIQNLKPGSGPGGAAGPVKYFNVNSALPDSSATGSNSMAVGPTATASGSNAIALGNGANASATNAVAIGSGSVADRANTVSVGSAGNARQITNVAAGTASTDAVNLAQLESSVTTSQQGTVRYDTNTDGTPNYSSVTLGNGNAGTAIHNVANGVATTDAVNMGQLNSGVTQAENWASAYTDQRVGQLNRQVQDVGHRADAGVAAGMAMAGLPQAYEPGRSMAAVSAGSFRGESSVAVGVSTISQGGRWVFKLTGSVDTRGDGGVAVGAGMQW